MAAGIAVAKCAVAPNAVGGLSLMSQNQALHDLAEIAKIGSSAATFPQACRRCSRPTILQLGKTRQDSALGKNQILSKVGLFGTVAQLYSSPGSPTFRDLCLATFGLTSFSAVIGLCKGPESSSSSGTETVAKPAGRTRSPPRSNACLTTLSTTPRKSESSKCGP